MITPKRSFELTMIGLLWVTSIFQIPGIAPLFGFIVVWAVLGFRSSVKVSLIGGIPTFIMYEIPQMIGFFPTALSFVDASGLIPKVPASVPSPPLLGPPSFVVPLEFLLIGVMLVYCGYLVNRRIKKIRRHLGGRYTFGKHSPAN